MVFLTRAREYSRLSFWSEPEIANSEMKVSVSVFTMPPTEVAEPRSCRPVDEQAFPAGNREVEQMRNHLASLCDEFERYREVLLLFDTFEAEKNRNKSILDLAEVIRPSK